MICREYHRLDERPENYFIHLLDDDVLFQQWTICPQYHRWDERPGTVPFTHSMMMCCSNKRRYVHNITRQLKDPMVFHSLTRWWYAVRTIDDMPTILHLKWKTRWYSIHLLNHHEVFQQKKMCPPYHRLHERPTLLHSLTRWWCAVSTTDDMSTILQVKWKSRNSSIHLLGDDLLFQQ
jgi:hypothetical protein